METNLEKSQKYNLSIVSPVYEIKGKKPKIKELYDISKVREILKGIEEAENVSDDDKLFLKIAAYRHSVFQYEKQRNIMQTQNLMFNH